MSGYDPEALVPPSPDNPAIGSLISIETGEDGLRTEIDLTEILLLELRAAGESVIRWHHCIRIGQGIFVQPGLVEFTEDEDGFVAAISVQSTHHTLYRNGLFDVLCARGGSLVEAIREASLHWMRLQMPALRDACRETPEHSLTMTFDLTGGRRRRAILGPIEHVRQWPPAADDGAEDDHAFCSCCMFTSALDAMQALIEREGTVGLALECTILDDGEAWAECRVDGRIWEEGSALLEAYARTWPPGFGREWRSQYAVLHDVVPE
jgi:hypothetical protein